MRKIFEQLLTHQEKDIYLVYQQLQGKSWYCLTQLSLTIGKSPASLRRLLLGWQKDPENQGLGIHFQLTNHQITLIDTGRGSWDFYSRLLHRSELFKLLHIILTNPFCSVSQLQKEVHLSPSTLHRRIQQLNSFLKSYDLSLSFKTIPGLKGSEPQIRWLAWMVSLLNTPPSQLKASYLFQHYQTIRQYRPKLISPWKPSATYYQPPMALDERGLTFLWKQLTGVEKLWLNAETHDAIAFVLHTQTQLNPLLVNEIRQILHQIHSLCNCFSGRFFIPNLAVSSEASRITAAFQQFLPAYTQLLRLHPELPQIYEYLLATYTQKKSFFLVADDSL